MDMNSWLKNKKLSSNKVKDRVDSLKIKHESRGLTETQAQAQAEIELLKPKKLADLAYLGKKANSYNTITFYFKSKEDFDLVAKYFKLSEYLGFNTHDTDLLMTFLKKIETGEIEI